MYVINIEMPVTLYLSSDDQAPVLTNANLSVILKACLVTGYGAKPGAGWTMPYEDAASNTRVFAPKHAGELDSYLRVKDNGSGNSTVRAYREMTGIDAGEKILELASPYEYGRNNLDGRWAVVASARSVVVWIYSGYNAGGHIGQMLYYGDTGSAHDGSRALLLAHSGGSYRDGSTSSLFYYGDASAGARAKSYRDDTGAREQDFLSLFSEPRETAGQYLAPVYMQNGANLYPVPGIHTNTRAADNLTGINDDGTPYIVLHSYGYNSLARTFARLVIRTDKWRY